METLLPTVLGSNLSRDCGPILQMRTLRFRDIVIAQGYTASKQSEIGQGENSDPLQVFCSLEMSSYLVVKVYGAYLSASCSL